MLLVVKNALACGACFRVVADPLSRVGIELPCWPLARGDVEPDSMTALENDADRPQLYLKSIDLVWDEGFGMYERRTRHPLTYRPSTAIGQQIDQLRREIGVWRRGCDPQINLYRPGHLHITVEYIRGVNEHVGA